MIYLTKKTKKEFQLVKKAIESENGKREIIEYLSPIVESAFKEYVDNKGISLNEKDEKLAIASGWKYLDFALNKYADRIEEIKREESESFDFSTYFTWFARQGIHEYVLELKNK